jgi:YbgC/YbaW family acyl-CoA thioester hydrolase
MWGLGFFYSMHIVWMQGWTGFWVFAIANACGLAMFGCALDTGGRDPETLFGRIAPHFVSLFLLCQIGAVAITLFSLGAYFWQMLIPDEHVGTKLALSFLIVAFACAVGHTITLRRLRLLHVGYFVTAAAAIAVAWVTMPASTATPVEIGPPAPLSVGASLLPTLVGFALGPWGDLQQWHRAVEIRRSGFSPAIAYVGGGLVFLALLFANASLSLSAGVNILVATDGAIGAQSSVAARFAQEASSPGLIAFAVWAFIATISTIDSFYCSVKWYVSSLLANSMHPALAFVPVAVAASPLWILGLAVAAAVAMNAIGLSQTAYMMPYATLLVGATVSLIAACFLRATQIDLVSCYLWGVAAASVFFIGYCEGIPLLVPLSTAIALVGALRPIRSMISARSRSTLAEMSTDNLEEVEPFGTSSDAPAHPVIAETSAYTTGDSSTANNNAVRAHGFDGQWFVMQVTPTYDDTNSVGNVYFANYVRWVGKARELFFNACMPKFDLETTRYYVLTKSFQHDFRREIAEFEPAAIRIRIASHNRKFVTLGHEIVSERHGLLGRGEQELMFVDRESFKPLDIPADIIRGFLPFWPSRRPDIAPSVAEEPRKAV